MCSVWSTACMKASSHPRKMIFYESGRFFEVKASLGPWHRKLLGPCQAFTEPFPFLSFPPVASGSKRNAMATRRGRSPPSAPPAPRARASSEPLGRRLEPKAKINSPCSPHKTAAKLLRCLGRQARQKSFTFGRLSEGCSGWNWTVMEFQSLKHKKTIFTIDPDLPK